MKKSILFWLLSALLPNLAMASYSLENTPPGCDTLTTANGKTYLVLVGWEGDQEIQYRLCDDQSGRVYAIQRDSIRELKRYVAPIVEVKTPVDFQKKDSVDLLTLNNGKVYRVVILLRDNFNTYYRLYDDPLDDRQYCVPNRDVRSVRLAKLQRTQRQKKNGCLIALSILLGLLLLMILGSISA